MKKQKKFNRLISAVLIVALLVGMIPETVYAPGRRQSASMYILNSDKKTYPEKNRDSDKDANRDQPVDDDRDSLLSKGGMTEKKTNGSSAKNESMDPNNWNIEKTLSSLTEAADKIKDLEPKEKPDKEKIPEPEEKPDKEEIPEPEEEPDKEKTPEPEEEPDKEEEPEPDGKDDSDDIEESEKIDQPPIVLLEGGGTYYRKESGICTITLTDDSHSPDGDVIQSQLFVTYDRDRDGIYEEACPEVIGCNGIYNIQTDAIGKYKARLVVTEQTENALTAQTEIDFKVSNKAPAVSGNALLEKKVTIMGITDKVLKEGEEPRIEEAIGKLTEEGYDVTYKSFHLKGQQVAALLEKHYTGEEQKTERGIKAGSQAEEAVSSRSLSANGILLSSQIIEGEEETVFLSWKSNTSIRNLAGYRLFRKLGEEAYTSISTWDGESHIKILNVYPGRKLLYLWMNEFLKNTKEEAGKGLLDIDSASFNEFNEEPDKFLLDNDGNYKYDVIMFGSGDCNGGRDLNEQSYYAALKFVQSGRGVLFGHDSVVQNAAQRHPWLAKFGELMGMTFHPHGALNAGGNQVDIVKEGTLTSYPWKLTGTLEVPYSHSSGQYVEGDFGKNTTIWMRYHGQNPVTDDNFYLLSKNSVAMIQTGHFSSSSDDEKKILANTLCYLKQYSVDDHTKDPTAYDMEAPEITNVDTYFTSTAFDKMALRIEGKDKGTIYRYFVQTVPRDEYSEIVTSNEIREEMKTGLKGFVVLVNDDPSKLPELYEKSILTGEIKNFVKAVDEQAYVDIPSKYIGKECYAHVCAVDNSDNVSEQITVKLDTAPNIYELQQFLQEEADYIVLDVGSEEFDLSEWANIEKAFVETGAEVFSISESLTDKILAKERKKQLAYTNHVFPGQRLFFETHYLDEENDPCREEEITIFNESANEKTIISQKEGAEGRTENIYTVSENGIYHIDVKVQDDPASGDERFSDYRAWSESYSLAKGLVCWERPVLKDLSVREVEGTAGAFDIAYDAYVPGKEALENRGISKVSLAWRKVGDSEWNYGELPRKPDIGCVYLLKAVATDEYGIDSIPKAAVIDAQAWSMSEGDSSLKVQNQVEILTLGGTEETCTAQLDEIKKICALEKCTISIRKGTDDSISFQEAESIRFIIIPDREYEKSLLDDPVMEKNIIQSNAVIICADNKESLSDTVKEKIHLLKRDVLTGMFCGMGVDYAGKYIEFSENHNYSVRLVVEYENALTGKPQTKTYLEAFTPEGAGAYNIYFQVAPKYKNGNVGRYQGEYPIVSNFHVYKRPTCKTTTSLSFDKKSVIRINASTSMEKRAFGKENYIKEITQQWKKMGGQWQNGALPSVLTRGETYLLKTTVTDRDGIASYPYVEIIYTDDVPVPDVTAPKVTIESPAAGERIAGPIDIIGSIYDDTQIAEYSISYDNGSGKKGSMTYTDTENKTSQKLGAIDFSELPNGAYTITVTAKDEWDNKASSSVRIINAYPLIKLTNVTADEEYVYVHGKINQINELTETVYSYRDSEGGREIPITGNEEVQDKGKYTGLIKVLEDEEIEDEGYYDGNIMSEEDILFRLPLCQMESGIYTFCAKGKDASGITTDAAIKAELIKKSTDSKEDETTTDHTSFVMLQFNSVELVEAEENQAEAGSKGVVSGNDTELIIESAGEVQNGETQTAEKATYVRIQGTYESTDEITEKIFGLKHTKTNADIPFTLQMENGSFTMTADADQMGQGDFEATGRLKNQYGCEAYATMSFRLSVREENKDITVEKTPDSNKGAFPSISAISFSEDRSLVYIKGDRAGYEHTTLTCEGVETGKRVNVRECDDNGIIGTMYSSEFESGQYKVTLTAYDDKGTVLGMASMLFTYTKGGKDDDNGSVSDNTVSDNTVSGNSADKIPPVIEMDIEDENYILTEAASLTGSIYDETALKEYTVTIIPEGEEEGILIGTGTEEIKEGIIAAIDPAALANGTYKVVIRAEDKAGNRKMASLGFTVDSKLKIGNMNIGFTDLVAKLPFGSLNLQRFYNSNNKACGDFGYGWTMGLTGMTLKENSDISRGYEQVISGMGFSTSYYIRETASHDITVNYGDGTSDRFKLTLSPSSSALVPIRMVKVGFTCQTSQGVTLELAGDNSAGLEGGMLLWEDESKFDEIQYVLTTKDKTKVYLTAEKGVYKIEDTLGNVITVDEDGYHGEGNKGITLTRNDEGLITKATDGNGKTVSYGYDGNRDLISFTNEAGNSVRFTYDEEHNLISIIDPMGVAAARNEYDETGRLTATIDAEGNRMEYAYDVEGRTQAVQDRRGNTTVYTYDENGNILKTVDPLGNATYNTYDGYGNLLTETDGNGNTTSYAYDGEGNITTVTDAEGNTTTSQYNTRNQITSLQNSDDARLLLAYNEKGQLSQTTDNGGNRTDYAYTSEGKLAGISDAIGTVTAYTYDKEGNVVKTRDGNGNETTYLYNEAGKCAKAITTKTTAEGVVQSETSYIYDASGNLVQTQDGEGRITKTEYDPCGRLCSSTDSQGRTTTYTHTATGELSAIHYDDGTSESFTYDEEGNLLTSKDRLGKTTRHAYDKAGNLVKTTDQLGNETTYAYDGAYRLTKVKRPTGAVTEYEYDSLGRNTKILSSDGSSILYAYDGAGNLTAMTDALGNTTKYEYDSLGNRCSIILPDGSEVKTAYDARGRITSQTDAS
ncbi:MAG: Ig-like domain-containing protein, partial [Roseburia sp.]|nr:Ig-like domain-containing protein [Roseburia sp.]MCM1279367.1 Ig-like domain-containing protein [Robinsoniella sp.]